MIDDHTHRLIEAWLDGTIDDVELSELEVAILESLAVRREFWRRATLHGMLHEAAKIEFAAVDLPDESPGPFPRTRSGPLLGRGGWLRSGLIGGVAMLVLSGCGIGSAVTSLALAYAGMLGRGQPAVVVHEESFEHPPAPERRGVPVRLDVWGGDESVVVAAEHGIVPRSGDKMLKFLAAAPGGVVGPWGAGEIWRCIDLESVRAAAGTRDVRIDFSACFNGCAGRGEPRFCWISAIATDAHPSELGPDWRTQFEAAQNNPTAVATAQSRGYVDADLATWQRFSVTVTAPPNARFLLLHCLTEYRPDEDQDVATGCGQYVDDIDVAVSAAPPSIVGAAPQRKGVR